MPGGDRTGPMGEGPMTGRGAGYCAGTTGVGYAPRRGFRLGLGRGFGGWGRGFAPLGQSADVDPASEKRFLKDRARFLQAEMDRIKGRVDAIESGEKGT